MSVQRFSKATIFGYNSRYTGAWSPNATGGVITDAGGYRIHTFTSTGSSDFTVIANISEVEYLLVAGGGGGGSGGSNTGGGGGAAGGLLTGTRGVGIGANTVTVGAGGVGNTTGNASISGQNGDDSVLISTTAVGGGRGGPNETISGFHNFHPSQIHGFASRREPEAEDTRVPLFHRRSGTMKLGLKNSRK